MRIISRKEWGARPPRSYVKTTWNMRTGYMVHYSGASADQTPRIIQDFHMDTRGWSDIGYNFLVHSVTGAIYEGRGWLVVGAHCKNHNTSNVGVCVIGKDLPNRKDVSDAARASVRWLYDQAVKQKGSRLAILGHRDRGSTECPGAELYSFVKSGLLVPAGTGGGTAPTPGQSWKDKAIMALDTLRQGDRGADVRKSQALLAAAGLPPANSFRSDGTPDGIAGPGWLRAVKAFQSARKIKADGIVGQQTWTELLR